MNKDSLSQEEQRKIQICLVVNAIVKFNLFPPRDSEHWRNKIGDYGAIVSNLLLKPSDNISYQINISEQLCKASMAITVTDKLMIYEELSILTGIDVNLLAGPVLPKMDENSLTGSACSLTLFKNTEHLKNLPDELANIFQGMQEFYNTPDTCYLWDDEVCYPPYTLNKIAALLCLELKKPENNNIALSCLYALATLLHRSDMKIALFDYCDMSKHVPKEILELYDEYILSQPNPLLEDNANVQVSATNVTNPN